MYDIIIIGGGISGFYTAFRILKEKPDCKILLLEKNDYFGGRIFTASHNGFKLEAGAGRFNQEHKLFIELLHELNLSKYQVEIDGEIEFIPSTKYDSKYLKVNPFDIMTVVLNRAKRTSRKELQKYAFIDYASTILDEDDIKFLKDSLGYYQQLMEMNAYDAFVLFEYGMHSKNTFFTLKNGMSQVITGLHNKIKHKCVCKKNMNVTNISYENDKFKISVDTVKNPYESKLCVAAIPVPHLMKIPYFCFLKEDLKSIKTKELCRIYSQFKKEDIWFKDINKTTTNNKSRYIIPINREKGWIMISYTDSIFAKYWKKMSHSDIIEKTTKNIEKTFKISIKKPEFTKVCYWDIGTSFWIPNVDSKKISKRIYNPKENRMLYICGESVSLRQGWMEGALESGEKVVNDLIKNL